MSSAETIMIWKFESAPPEVRSLHAAGDALEWVVLVPASVYGVDLEDAIRRRSGMVVQYRTPNEDVVFMGAASIADLLESLMAIGHTPMSPQW